MITENELRAFVERYERLEQEKKDIAAGQKEVMAEAKGRGYCASTLKRIVFLRKKPKAEIDEQEALLEIYKQAIGM